jgi:hypothetical protein
MTSADAHGGMRKFQISSKNITIKKDKSRSHPSFLTVTISGVTLVRDEQGVNSEIGIMAAILAARTSHNTTGEAGACNGRSNIGCPEVG